MAPAKNNAAPSYNEVADAFETISKFFRFSAQMGGGIFTSPEPDDDAEKLNEDDVRALPLMELRKLAVELELDEQKVKKGILEEIASKGLFEESDEEEDEDAEEEADEDEDEDDTSDDEDGEEDELTREDLEDMDLKELRVLAKEEGHPRNSYIKADKDALIDLLLGDEEEEDEDEDGDEEEEELDEETIRAMSLAELKTLAKELDVKIPVAIAKNRKKIADKILEESAEEE